MKKLVETCSVLATIRALADQGRVSCKDDAFPDTSISLSTDLAIVELNNKRTLINTTSSTIDSHAGMHLIPYSMNTLQSFLLQHLSSL